MELCLLNKAYSQHLCRNSFCSGRSTAKESDQAVGVTAISNQLVERINSRSLMLGRAGFLAIGLGQSLRGGALPVPYMGGKGVSF